MALHKWDIWAKSELFKLKENKFSERNYKWTINYLINQDTTTNFYQRYKKKKNFKQNW